MNNKFIADAIHDLSNPLNVIKLRLTQMERDTTHLPHHLRVLEHQVERLEHLISNLLVLSRFDEGELTHELMPLDLNPLIHQVMEAHLPLAAHKGITLLFDPERALPSILADRRQMERVLVNLINNALHYTKDGGRILISTTSANGQVYCLVADSGIGIDPHDLPHIFDRFYRSEAAKNLHQQGSGLGLAIVRELVHFYGGDVSVESERYKGTRFTLSLPIWEAAANQKSSVA
jgi:signal transduction histidine kinase